MAPPLNDNFANAAVLASGSLPGSISGTTLDATKEVGETSFQSNDQSVWFRFTAPADGWYKFWIDEADVIPNPGRGLMLAIGDESTLAAWSPTACESEIRHPNSFALAGDWVVSAFIASGTTYYIRVGSPTATNTATANFTLRWDEFTPPVNDDIADAIDLGSLPVTQVVSTLNATFEVGEPTEGVGSLERWSQGVWYTFTAPADGVYKISLDEAFTYQGTQITGMVGGIPQNPGAVRADVFIDTVDTVAEASIANMLIPNNSQPIVGQTTTEDDLAYMELQNGLTYHIRVRSTYRLKGTLVGEGWNSQVGSTTLKIEATNPPANDSFASPTVLGTSLPGGLASLTTKDATAESGEVVWSGNPNQSIWFTFTPTVTGTYVFRIPRSSVIYQGVGGSVNLGELELAISDQSTLAGFTQANQIGSGSGFTSSEIGYAADAFQVAELVASTTYRVLVNTRQRTGIFNNSVCEFELQWDLAPSPANDDFVNRTTISGASGSENFGAAGGTYQVADNEPLPDYQAAGLTAEWPTVWFEWTCPADGDYFFKVETTEPLKNEQATYDLAIWTGSVLASLTKIMRNWAGEEPPAATPSRATGTKVGFHATNGTVYQIQILHWSAFFDPTGASQLTWGANVITGNTTADAATLASGRVDNHGNDESEPPPNFSSRLSAHNEWWFTDGQVGKCKWFKLIPAFDDVIIIDGKMWDGFPDSGQAISYSTVGLLVYRGANHASLTPAVSTIAQGSVDAAMMMMASEFAESEGNTNRLIDVTGAIIHLEVDVFAGEPLWVCLFGLYDADIAGSSPEDAAEFELDLHAATGPPANDNWLDAYNIDLADLTKSHWNSSFSVYNEAGLVHGSTIEATAEVGEVARAGFAATRSIWYYWNYNRPGTYRFWVESVADCVLGIYEVTNSLGALGSLLVSDDDSGAGNQPQIDFVVPLDPETFNGFAIVVDSKTEAPVTLKWERLSAATPPANDDFADAEVVVSVPGSVGGTTVGATAEAGEWDAEWIGSGVRDTVWYKWTADFSGQIQIRASCDTANDDAYVFVDVWAGSALDTLIRALEPPPDDLGWFSFFDTLEESIAKSLTVNVVNGQDYYIRVQTESGGSEDFTLYFEEQAIYLNLIADGSEEMHGTLIDSGTVYLDIQHTGVEVFHQVITVDSATIDIRLTPGAIWETLGHETTDSDIVLLDLSVLGGECFSRFHFTGEGEAETRWAAIAVNVNWLSDVETRWGIAIEVQPGCD